MQTVVRNRAALIGLIVLAFFARASATERIESLNADVFRALQHVLKQVPGGAMGDAQVTMLGRAITRDDKVDEAERKLAAALGTPEFDLVVAAQPSTYWKPRDIVLKGSLPESARAIIAASTSPEALAAAKARREGPDAGESWSAFHLRSGPAGVAGLINHASKSPENWTEARAALAKNYRARFDQAGGLGSLRMELVQNVHLIAAMPAEQRQAGVLLHLEACALADAEAGGAIPQGLYAEAFGVSVLQAQEIAVRIGIAATAL